MNARTVLLRSLLGFPLGVFINYVILIAISYGLGAGTFYVVPPAMVESFGSELNAVSIQFLLSGLLGLIFAGASAIFEVERWSILRRTVAHFLITATTMFAIAYLCHWMSHNLVAALIYMGIFIALYVIIWFVQMLFWRKHVADINKKLG